MAKLSQSNFAVVNKTEKNNPNFKKKKTQLKNKQKYPNLLRNVHYVL
jgi:hypothetical protein